MSGGHVGICFVYSRVCFLLCSACIFTGLLLCVLIQVPATVLRGADLPKQTYLARPHFWQALLGTTT